MVSVTVHAKRRLKERCGVSKKLRYGYGRKSIRQRHFF